jgi:hypothetical protein
MSLKNSNDTIGNRVRVLLAVSSLKIKIPAKITAGSVVRRDLTPALKG